VHFITGGSDHEQQREGDFLGHDARYDRTREYIEIVKRAWTSHEAFDHEGTHYRFRDFVADVFPVQQPHPLVSFGGSSEAAYAVGGAVADIYCLWGEPLAEIAAQVARVRDAVAAAGRTDMPKIQVAFRPIIGPTEDAAWEKAHATVERIRARRSGHNNPWVNRLSGKVPENTGSQRLIEIARQGERYDRALWTATALATGGAGNSNALVGTPETVAAALLDYVDLGVDILSARGYDTLADAVEFGDLVIPIVREEVAKRDRAVSA
jgi:alkanesulfonate monooxygenase